jgi:hypothetical protein
MHGWINDRFVRRKAELPSILSILRILHIAKWNRMYYNDLCRQFEIVYTNLFLEEYLCR